MDIEKQGLRHGHPAMVQTSSGAWILNEPRQRGSTRQLTRKMEDHRFDAVVDDAVPMFPKARRQIQATPSVTLGQEFRKANPFSSHADRKPSSSATAPMFMKRVRNFHQRKMEGHIPSRPRNLQGTCDTTEQGPGCTGATAKLSQWVTQLTPREREFVHRTLMSRPFRVSIKAPDGSSADVVLPGSVPSHTLHTVREQLLREKPEWKSTQLYRRGEELALGPYASVASGETLFALSKLSFAQRMVLQLGA